MAYQIILRAVPVIRGHIHGYISKLMATATTTSPYAAEAHRK